jgi:YVTN family beta-propeller protein
VIDTATNRVVASVIVGNSPVGVAVHPGGSFVYVTNSLDNTVSVIDTASNRVSSTVAVGPFPIGIAVDRAGSFVYVANSGVLLPGINNTATLSVISTAGHRLFNTITMTCAGFGLAIHPSGDRIYATHPSCSRLSVISTASGTEVATIYTGGGPNDGAAGVAMDPTGTRVYPVVYTRGLVAIVDTGANVLVGFLGMVSSSQYAAFGQFIGPVAPTPQLSSAVLPSSRSVQVGHPATAFATIINASQSTATRCSVAPLSIIPATFVFQATDPATNQPTGTPNTPVNIAPNGFQTFVISITPSGTFLPTDVAFNFSCANTGSATVIPGLNTLLLSASTSPTPDIVALAASSDPGIVDIPGVSATGAFAVATVNVGVSALITVSADTGGTALPVTVSLCQTVTATGSCLTAPSSSVTAQINSGQTPSFAVFVKGTGSVPFDPATNRIFVRFKDAGGVTRGSTSVAVRTQ